MSIGGTPRRRSLRGIANLVDGEENVSFKGQILMMEDTLHPDKCRKIRSLVLSDGVRFIQLSAWDQNRSLFATQTQTDFNASVSPTVNGAWFKNLLGKTIVLKNVATTAAPSEMFNLGSAGCSLSFKHVSSVEIVEDEDSQIRMEQAYAMFLAQKRFGFDWTQVKFIDMLVLNQQVDVMVCLIGSDQRFLYNEGVLNCVVELTCKHVGNVIKITGWNFFGFILKMLCNGKEGSMIAFKNVKVNRAANLLFNYASKMTIARLDERNISSLQQMVGISGNAKGPLQLLILTSVNESTSDYAPYVAIASDGHHKCQLFVRSQSLFAEDDEIVIKSMQVNWKGSVLSVIVLDDSVTKILEDKIIDENIAIDDLAFPKKE
ncbi:hypothetical protein Ddc_15977 [Ditylenchus destructor]|nr:hypothetical protein Ddc_15977 [Ditylenchus destructor]